MLTNSYKEEVLQKLETMTSDDFIKIFEEIGSHRTINAKDINKVVSEELEHYGIVKNYKEYNPSLSSSQTSIIDKYECNDVMVA